MLTSLVIASLAFATGAQAWKDQCQNFLTSPINGTKILSSTYYDANALVNISVTPFNTVAFSSVTAGRSIPAFCRVALNITTNPTSGSWAYAEIWLPDAWNKRFLTVGSGGFGGSVSYPVMAYDGVEQGFAVTSSDMGHRSSSREGIWALNNLDSQADFGYRATHLNILAGKSLTSAYYSSPISKSYFLGCSTGGRQAIREATLYPDSFDGMAFGTPANQWAGLMPWEARQNYLMGTVNGSTWITPEQWGVWGKEVLRACDGLDGVVDGVITDPSACPFRPEAIVCKPGQSSSTCLSIPQIAILHQLYEDYYVNGTYIFSGYEVGGEAAYPLATSLSGATPFALPAQWYSYFIFNQSTLFNVSQITPQQIQAAFDINPGNMDVKTDNYTAFFSRGGKMLQYAGMADQLISPGETIRKCNRVQAFTAANSNMVPTDSHRLFLATGMGHCTMGPGAFSFGGPGQRATGDPPLVNDAEHDVLKAVVRWVETGQAPDLMLATKYVNDNVTQGVKFTRKMCLYPAKPVFQGGDNTKHESYRCM